MILIVFLLVFIQSTQSTTKRSTPAPQDSQVHSITVPASCENLTYCIKKTPDYPSEEIKKILQNYDTMGSLPVLLRERRSIVRQSLVGEKMHSHDDCEQEIEFRKPYYARSNVKQPWNAVIQDDNDDGSYVQMITSVTCQNNGKSCFKPFYSALFSTVCHQSYTRWKLWVKSPGGNGTENLYINVPSCCSCKYKRQEIFTMS